VTVAVWVGVAPKAAGEMTDNKMKKKNTRVRQRLIKAETEKQGER
jgi:hypothetical protein